MKNGIVACAVSCLLLGACAPAKDDTKALDTENIAVVEQYLAAVQNKDSTAMQDLLADNYMGYGPSVNDSINKADALANWKDLSKNFYESIHYDRSFNLAAELKEGVHPGHYVSNWARLTIKYKDGRGPVHLNVNVVYRVENKKITLSRAFYNEADVLRQLGAL